MKKQIIFIAVLLVTFTSFLFSQGSRYAGPYTFSTPIKLNGASNLTIRNLEINNPNGACIELLNCTNITIENCKLGPSKSDAVYLYKSSDITVIDCIMNNNATGVYAGACTGISIMNNEVINVQGPLPRGQMVQFAEVYGANNQICYNVVENELDKSHPEDAINLFKTNGTDSSPIKIIGNWIRGGGPSDSGGGIMTGDMGGSYIQVLDNILVNPGQYGVTIASGHHISIKNNKIYGKQSSFSNIGLSAYKQYNIDTHNDTIMNNEVNFTHFTGELNCLLNDNKCGIIYGWSTNQYNPNLNESILPDKIIGRAKVQGITTETTAPKSLEQRTKIFPNPAYNQLTIETSSELKNGKVEIYNISGQKMATQTVNGNKTEINSTNFLVGVYIVKVMEQGKVIEQQKIMIRK